MRLIGMAIVLLGLAACDAVYRTPAVTASAGQGTNVRVISVTAETVVQANRSPFTPASLPAVFSQTVGSGGAVRETRIVPDGPFQAEIPPRSLTLRLPPEAPFQPYQIGVGDVLLLSTPTATGNTVAELAGLLAAQNSRQGYTVQDDGTINIPNVGRVDLAGRSIEDAEARLFQELVRNQIDPTFSLEIAEFNSQRVSIGGSVSNPTIVPLTLVSLYLDEVLARAGGISVGDIDYASVRLYRDGTLFQIPLTQLYTNTQLTRIRLKDGDVLFVDSVFELDRASEYFEQQLRVADIRHSDRQSALQELQTEIASRRSVLDEARQNFQTRLSLGADARQYVYLAGEVSSQSRFPLPYERRAVLSDALFENGGIASSTGDVSQIYVLRGSTHPREFGAVTAWNLDLRNAANFVLASQFELRPDDTIFIAQQPVTRWDRAWSQIIPQLITIGAQVN